MYLSGVSLARLTGLLGACVAAASLVGPGCLARGDDPLVLQTADDGGKPPPQIVDGGVFGDAGGELPPIAPHAVQAVDPPHGPWNGGQSVLVRGNGFKPSVRVWFGDVELTPADVTPIDPKRVQVVVPPGIAGAVDVTTQNGEDASTRATLPGGYEYDLFYAAPASGPTSGGTLISLFGQGTEWSDTTAVLVDNQPCEPVTVVGPHELSCPVPPGTPGTKPIRVVTGDGVAVDVLDAFTYGDSDNGYKGGLSGKPLKSELRVIALDAWTGNALGGATVIAGDDLASAIVKQTSGSGVVVIQDPNLGPKRTVTIAMKCFQPLTFVDVPVDTVTAYLYPVLKPACAEEGDLPPTGGNPSLGANVSGELVWQSVKEFERAGWTNVPQPASADEQLVAYVFRLSDDPKRDFQLPGQGSAITPSAPGKAGYAYSYGTNGGNHTLYALAGIENRVAVPAYFVAYAMGITKGVGTQPGQTTSEVFIKIDIPLDHALTLAIDGPSPTVKGPDRVLASVAVRVNEQGYAIFPFLQKSVLYPTSAPLPFIGIPPLVGALGGAQYVAAARAVTGSGNLAPRSVVGLLATTVSGVTLTIDGFVQIPKLTSPGTNGAFAGTELGWTLPAGGASVELSVVEIQSGGGLVRWLVAAPSGVTHTKLPDLAALDPELGLIDGPVTIALTAAHIDAFDYGSLRYRQLDDRGWNAYATDLFHAHY
jgi:hypothetical protein